MVTRRSTHANHAKSGGTPRRSAQRRTASRSGSLHAGGAKGARGGTVGNVGSFGGTESPRASSRRKPSHGQVGPNTIHAANQNAKTHKRESSSNSASSGIHIPTANGEILLTRRHFLFGALGIGAVAAIGGGASYFIKKKEEEAANAVPILKVPTSAVTEDSAFALNEDPLAYMSQSGRFELPYGTLVWANGDDVAACLIPNDEAKPLSKVALLSLASGNLSTVLEQAVGQNEGFDVYDVRATASGMIWLEADILDGIWRVYTATSDGASIGTPRLVDEGDSEWETPSISAVGKYAFWQVLPKIGGLFSTEDSLVKRAVMGSGDAETVYTSHGRLCTAPYGLSDSVVITPRAETTGTYYQLTLLDAASGDVRDSMVLPVSMRPLEAAYGDTGFMFSFDAIYNYGDGIANLGTYAPLSKVNDGNYSNAPWFRFGQSPTAAPSWCGQYLMVKSKSFVYGINLKTSERFTIKPESGSDTYGEYLASTGSNDTVVTFANIDDKPINGEAKKYCVVSTWTPLA